MSVREFAAHLGVSERMVSKWEAGGPAIRPRPLNQEALDTSLALAGAAVQARFAVITDRQAVRIPGRRPGDSGRHVVTHPVDEKLMVLVDAGPFLSGPDNRQLWMPAYYLDVYPTTNADFGRFVASTGHRPPSHWPGGVCPDALLDHPVVFVTWHDADAYALWADKALPSQHEWEKAARGVRGAIYPWGDRVVAAAGVCNVRESGLGTTTPVRRYHNGVSPYGAYDMCGNVWEWCGERTEADRCVLKGGAFTGTLADAAPTTVHHAPADGSARDVGFRCVKAAQDVLDLLAI